MPDALIAQLFRQEYKKIVAVLCKLFGSIHLEAAEDIANDTFLYAAESWGLKGIPANPVAWLYLVAKNKTRDYLKRNRIFSEKVAVALQQSQPFATETEVDLSAENIRDSQLRMLFVVCNPVIAAEAQVALALRVLCGFGVEEIAEAFLTGRETISKRLQRAREKLRMADIGTELPAEQEIGRRLESVLTTLYLLFNEGYYSSTRNRSLRKELCVEAMQLTYFLTEQEQTNTPKVNALLSLMCFHASRLEARVNEAGEYVLYDVQDRDLWNDDLVAQGNHYLIRSAAGDELSKYHLEASIAYWHSTKAATEKKWENILLLYDQLLQIEYSPVTAMNRAFVLSRTQGKQEAIREAEKLDLADSHLYHSLLGYLYTGIDNDRARAHYGTALRLARTENDRTVIRQHINNLS